MSCRHCAAAAATTEERGSCSGYECDARAFVEEHAASGLTIAAFARERGIEPKRLQRWRTRFGIRSEIAARSGRLTEKRVAPITVRIARVERGAPSVDAPPNAPVNAPSSPSSAVLTIEVGGARVAVPAGFDASTVRAVLGALLVGGTGGAR